MDNRAIGCKSRAICSRARVTDDGQVAAVQVLIITGAGVGVEQGEMSRE